MPGQATAMSNVAHRIATELRQQLASTEDVTLDRVQQSITHHAERSLAGFADAIENEEHLSQEVFASLTGFGPLQPLLDDRSIEEIWINSPSEIFVARNGVSERLAMHLGDEQVRQLVDRMLAHTGRRVDLSQPFVDASLPDGSRLHVVIPDITRTHWSINIRKFHANVRSLTALVAREMLTPSAAKILQDAMRTGANILVSGPTHAGKTTLLSALLSASQSSQRVITVEETFEISCGLSDVVAMQCRPANLEGLGEITLRRLVKEALRMRPDRLVVGEVREAESLDLLIALNSGIPGLATIHANSARDALLKLCTLPLLAGRNIDANFVVPTVATCIDLVVHCRMTPDGHRYVNEILAPSGAHNDGVIEASSLYRHETETTVQSTGVAA